MKDHRRTPSRLVARPEPPRRWLAVASDRIFGPRDVPLVQGRAERQSGSYSLGTPHPPQSGLSMATGSLSASSTNATTRAASGTATTATSRGNSTTMAREAPGGSINDVPVDESERRIFGPRPESERGSRSRSGERGRPGRNDSIGFRKVLDATFMIGFLVTGTGVSKADSGKYLAGLRQAQMEIDLHPEAYKHYHLRAVPEKYRDQVDVRAFGTGERTSSSPTPGRYSLRPRTGSRPQALSRLVRCPRQLRRIRPGLKPWACLGFQADPMGSPCPRPSMTRCG